MGAEHRSRALCGLSVRPVRAPATAIDDGAGVGPSSEGERSLLHREEPWVRDRGSQVRAGSLGLPPPGPRLEGQALPRGGGHSIQGCRCLLLAAQVEQRSLGCALGGGGHGDTPRSGPFLAAYRQRLESCLTNLDSAAGLARGWRALRQGPDHGQQLALWSSVAAGSQSPRVEAILHLQVGRPRLAARR